MSIRSELIYEGTVCTCCGYSLQKGKLHRRWESRLLDGEWHGCQVVDVSCPDCHQVHSFVHMAWPTGRMQPRPPRQRLFAAAPTLDW